MVASGDLPEHVLDLPLQKATEVLVLSGALHTEELLVEKGKRQNFT